MTLSPKLVHLVTVADSLIFLRGQCAYMAEHGMDVTVISSPDNSLDLFAKSEGISCYPVPMRRAISPFADVVAVARLMRAFRQIRPDIVHAHTPKAGLLGTIAARLTRVKRTVYHIHGLPFETATGMRRILLKSAEWLSCHLADSVLCVSESCLEEAHRSGVCASHKGSVIASGSINGVDAKNTFVPASARNDVLDTRRVLGLADQDRVVGFVGRVVKDKGIEDLAVAWSALRERIPDAHLLIVGDTEPMDPIGITFADQLLRDPSVHQVGHVQDPAPLYAVMTVLAQPSHREGFGMAALEASACAVPVVASDIPGLQDAVENGVTGSLVPPHSSKDLAEWLEVYLTDQVIARQHGMAGRQRALDQFEQERIWMNVASFYTSLSRV